ncbi:MAG: P-loop NTPase [Myxococcota bacterium]
MANSKAIVAVGGGKGGVGKSVVASNMAIAAAKSGFRTVLVDVDLGAANQHTLFGIDRPGITLQALLEKQIKSLEEAVIPTGVPRLFLVPGAGAVPGAANLPHAQKQKLIRHFKNLDADLIILDCGAGVAFNTVDFFVAADHRVLVVTPQLTSLQNAYAFQKSAVYRALRQTALNSEEVDILKGASTGRETERVAELVAGVAREDPDFSAALTRVVKGFSASVVGNQLEHQGQINVLHALSRMVSDFLWGELSVWGAMTTNPKVHRSVTRRRPFLLDASLQDPDAELFHSLVEKVFELDVDELRSARRRTIPPASNDQVRRKRRSSSPQLPAELTHYLRRHDRLSVDWKVTLRRESGDTPVLAEDISGGGIGLQVGDIELELDEAVKLRFDLFEGTPELRGVVRNVDPSRRRVGIEFVGKASLKVAAEIVSSASQEARKKAG